jgi:hypothetical protein
MNPACGELWGRLPLDARLRRAYLITRESVSDLLPPTNPDRSRAETKMSRPRRMRIEPWEVWDCRADSRG